MYGGVAASLFNDVRILKLNRMEWEVNRKDEEEHDLQNRSNHCVGTVGNFLVAFGGAGAYAENIKSRQMLNDVVVFDTEKGSYTKVEGNLAAVSMKSKDLNMKLAQTCLPSGVRFDIDAW